MPIVAKGWGKVYGGLTRCLFRSMIYGTILLKHFKNKKYMERENVLNVTPLMLQLEMIIINWVGAEFVIVDETFRSQSRKWIAVYVKYTQLILSELGKANPATTILLKDIVFHEQVSNHLVDVVAERLSTGKNTEGIMNLMSFLQSFKSALSKEVTILANRKPMDDPQMVFMGLQHCVSGLFLEKIQDLVQDNIKLPTELTNLLNPGQ